MQETHSFVTLYWNGHNLFVQPASSRLFVRISLRCPLKITRYYVIRDVIVYSNAELHVIT